MERVYKVQVNSSVSISVNISGIQPSSPMTTTWTRDGASLKNDTIYLIKGEFS